jgi:RNA polymerase sigma factor (sigma-70 family)
VHDLAALLQDGAALSQSDPELLERFLASRGEEAEDAFAALVHRHGPMVLGVCRRVLGNPDDAEDAFQAAFLVLARKARSIARRERLANWLYGVAVRTAWELKALKVRRLAREGQVNALVRSKADAAPDENLDELREALDEELSRLSDAFRGPVVLCDLQGKTHLEAARILGLPVGTVSSRLVRAREKLRKRLVRRGLSISAGTIAAFYAFEASAHSVSPALVATTSRAAAECLVGALATTSISTSVASLSKGVVKSLWIGKLASRAAILSLFLAASVGAAVGMIQLAGQGESPPIDRAAPDNWSWVDALPNADASTKERLKRCARSALENFAKVHRLTYDFDLSREAFLNDGKNNFTFQTHTYKGKLYWNEGAVRYDFEGRAPHFKRDEKGQWQPGPKGTFSVLRTRDLAAQIEDHELYGVVLKVDQPPKSLDAWRSGLHPLKDLDPWLHYASCFRPEPMSPEDFWSSHRLIESQEDGETITLRFTYAKNPGWMEVTCDKSCENLPVRWKYGDVQKGKKLTWGEETNGWKKTDGVWYPAHYEKTSFVGAEMRPTKEFDLRVVNLRANTAAKIPAAVFTLSDLPMPEGGYGGWDNRHQPRLGLVRANGVVRERRPGEPFPFLPKTPIPFPRITDATVREKKIDTENYLALTSEYAAKQKAADERLMKAKTESEQSAAIEAKARLESDYADRLLALAEKHRSDGVALDALTAVAVNQFTPRQSMQAALILIRDHLKSQAMTRVYSELDSPHLALSEAGEELLRAGIAEPAAREGRAQACLRLARHLHWRARTLRQLMGPGPDPFLALCIKAADGDVLKNTPPDAPDALDKEAEQLYEQIAKEFADVPTGSETTRDHARRELFKLRELAVGKPAPEAEGPDALGKPMKLSDYQGKVVVLTFTGSWYRDREYPRYRSLVDRMEGRPFALLCVNVDTDKETLLNSIKDGEVTWRCWWEPGEDGLNRRRWMVNEISSVFVIDQSGIIQGKEVEGKALEALVERLLDQRNPSHGPKR